MTSPGGPRVALGMTLYNNATHLRGALESLLAQTHREFALFMLDDASSDESELIAHEYVARDPRVRYFRHDRRRAMIATWREVAEVAARECPSAVYFAWVSDHDLWDARWLETLIRELDADPGLVLAYPVTRRLAAETGAELEKGPRLFETATLTDRVSRWSYFCRHGVGAGDMVYGLMPLHALRQAGIFRTVLRPDRLLIAELTLLGRIRQVPDVLWFRRQSAEASVSRQTQTLVLPDEAPPGFGRLPWLQHARVLWREYVSPEHRLIPLPTIRWILMIGLYQVSYGWRHFRKTEASHAVGRGLDNVVWTRKLVRHHFHHAVYNILVGGRAAAGKARRTAKRTLYHVLVFSHRFRRRGRSGETPVQ